MEKISLKLGNILKFGLAAEIQPVQLAQAAPRKEVNTLATIIGR